LHLLCHWERSHQATVHSVITACHHCHNWPSGTVIETAAPRRAHTWQPRLETVAVVEHYHRAHDPCSPGINRGAGVTCSFYPYFFSYLWLSTSSAPPPDQSNRELAPPSFPFTPALILTVARFLHLRRRQSSSSLAHCLGRSDLCLQPRRRSTATVQALVSSSSCSSPMLLSNFSVVISLA
jgi:hypothetical protein